MIQARIVNRLKWGGQLLNEKLFLQSISPLIFLFILRVHLSKLGTVKQGKVLFQESTEEIQTETALAHCKIRQRGSWRQGEGISLG